MVRTLECAQTLSLLPRGKNPVLLQPNRVRCRLEDGVVDLDLAALADADLRSVFDDLECRLDGVDDGLLGGRDGGVGLLELMRERAGLGLVVRFGQVSGGLLQLAGQGGRPAVVALGVEGVDGLLALGLRGGEVGGVCTQVDRAIVLDRVPPVEHTASGDQASLGRNRVGGREGDDLLEHVRQIAHELCRRAAQITCESGEHRQCSVRLRVGGRGCDGGRAGAELQDGARRQGAGVDEAGEVGLLGQLTELVENAGLDAVRQCAFEEILDGENRVGGAGLEVVFASSTSCGGVDGHDGLLSAPRRGNRCPGWTMVASW